MDESFVAVCSADDVPKGLRKEVVVDGKAILLFWYRNELRAVEARSPAEGAYSQGFLRSKFTEDYGIVCPSTNTVFSMLDGSVVEWYPKNPVLKLLIPQDTCRPLEIYPVMVSTDGKVMVSFAKGSQGGVMSRRDKGGVGTAADDSDVFYKEPKMYIEGQSPAEETITEGKEGAKDLNPTALLLGTVLVAAVGVGGTALAVYNESVYQLVAFWGVGFAVAAFGVNRYLGLFGDGGDGRSGGDVGVMEGKKEGVLEEVETEEGAAEEDGELS